MKRSNPLLIIALIAACFVFASRYIKTTTLGPAAQEDGISVYFSPDGGCTEAVVHQINLANQTIDMQAYSFTSTPIASALAAAHDRGVKIRAVLDEKENETGKYSGASYISDHGIPTYLDGVHAIAHNKVMIIDDSVIITGSFNFTRQAEDSNAENLLIIEGKPKLVAAYEANFEHHLSHSQPYQRSIQ